MNYKIIGDADCSMAHIELTENEEVKIERGAMVYTSNVLLEGKTNSSKGGVLGAFSAMGRSLASGESMFITHARGITNDAYIGIAPKIPGKIKCLNIDNGHQYKLNRGAFLACDKNVNYIIKSQKLKKAMFGGTGGFFVMETEGVGQLLVNAYGDLIELDISSDKPITIDNEHVIAWDNSLDYNIKVASGVFGFKTGEGFVNEFHGNGKILIQTRNIRNFADVLIPFFPQNNSNKS